MSLKFDFKQKSLLFALFTRTINVRGGGGGGGRGGGIFYIYNLICIAGLEFYCFLFIW